jgi:hypothetical protein
MVDWKDAVQCRNRAEMLRDIADKSKDNEFKAALLNVATQYESMAASVELELRGQTAPDM